MKTLGKVSLILGKLSNQMLFLMAKWSIGALAVSLVLLFFYFIKNLFKNRIEALELLGIIVIQSIALIFLYISIKKIKREIEIEDYVKGDDID